MAHMLLGGTSGIRKTYFSKYIVWRLLRVDGVEVHQTPVTILFHPTQSLSWQLYSDGRIYIVKEIREILATPEGLNLFNRTNAWIISGGAPPPSLPLCNTLVISSPGQVQAEDIQSTRKYKKGTLCTVYLLTWTPDEIWTAASAIYGLGESDGPELLHRFQKYGGIPRSILQNFSNPVEDTFEEFFK